MNATPSVIAFGEALWDVFCHPGARRERRLGGAPANFAFHVAQQGVSACALSAVGNDAAGEALAAELSQTGAPHSLQRVPFATGEVEVALAAGGQPRYTIHANAAWDHLTASPEWLQMARHACALCFGSLAQRCEVSRGALHALLAAMPPESWRIFDVNLRCGFYTPAILCESFRAANVVKLNEEELEIVARMEGFWGMPQLEQARLLMQRYALHLLILTCGAQGSYVLGEGVLSFHPTPRVEVVDTVGAGDSFTACFIAGLLRGVPVPQAHAAAVRLAAFVCTQAGAMPPVPDNLVITPVKIEHEREI